MASLIGTGCGDSATGRPPAVRVGDASIAASTVARWTKAVGLGKTVGASLGRANGTNREKALDFLISAAWLTEEAAARGLGVPDSTTEHGLQERIDSVPNGRSEFEEEISSTGQTVADVKLEIKAEAAAAMLRAMLNRSVRPVTQTDIANYYTAHRVQFRIPDSRLVDLVEGIRSRAEAIALGKRIGPGKAFARKALHEHVGRQTPQEAAQQGNGELVRTILAATPGKVAGPVRFADSWILVVVRKVVPAGMKSLAAAREEIATRLSTQRRQAAVLSFIEAYRSKWTAKTDCRPGYVVQKCSQYHGPIVSEGNPLLGN